MLASTSSYFYATESYRNVAICICTLPQTQEPDNNQRLTSRSNYKAREESTKEYIIIWDTYKRKCA